MTDELDVPTSNKQERIEVIGIHDKRTILKDSLPETSPDNYTKLQTTEIVEKLAKKFYINGKDSPLRDIYKYFTTKEKAIKSLSNHFGTPGMMSIPWKSLQEEFVPRVKEYKEGNNVDLIYECRRFRGDDTKIDIRNSNHQQIFVNIHRNKYIEFLLKESKH